MRRHGRPIARRAARRQLTFETTYDAAGDVTVVDYRQPRYRTPASARRNVRLGVSSATPPSRAPLVAIMRGLPDVELDLFASASRLAGRAVRTTVTLTVRTLDLATGPAPIQTLLRTFANRIAPAQARGAQIRRAEVSRVEHVGRVAGNTVISMSTHVIERIPINSILATIDLNALLARVDLNALLAGIDLGPIINDAMTEVDFGSVIRESTSGIGTELRDMGRVSALNGDDLVAHIVDRILHRKQRQVQLGLAK